VHSWSTFGAWTNHGQTQTYKTHHNANLGEVTSFPLIVFSMPSHKAYTQMSFCLVRIPKFPKLKLLRLWRLITSFANLWFRWGLKQSCNLHRKLSNSMWHATCMQVNKGDSWLLMVGNQIGNLTFGPFFGHNLCFEFPNGSCELILGIQIPRAFQWYKDLFNPMSFDLWNRPLNIRESIEALTPKVGTHFGVWGFIPLHSHTLSRAWNVTPKLHYWLTPWQAFALAVSPKLGLWQM